MKFFVPAADSSEQAESVYQSVKQFVEEQADKMDDRRIFKLGYTHNSVDYLAKVGSPHSMNGEPIVAIFKVKDYGLYYVCTTNRGVARGEPVLVGKHDVRSVEDFEPE